MKEISINSEQIQWEEFVGYPQGTRICVLKDG